MKSFGKGVQVFLLLGILNCTALIAQDARKDLAQLQATFADLDKVLIDLEVSVYPEGKSQPEAVQRFKMHKDGKNFYYDMGKMELLVNTQYKITVTHERKVIFCQKQQGEALQSPGQEQLLQTMLDSALAQYEHIEYKGKSPEGWKHYRLEQPGGQISQTDLYLSADARKVHRVRYRYNALYTGESQEVEIEYKRFETRPQFAGNLFSETRFVRQTKEGLEPARQYAQYRVVH
ncbi:hypothetical protein AAG747_21685 [Rapidithrix thailandica]|uniref:Outer membrane lipoprotein-sorting protein n=1 Tax=Rapidithrix thailandica TaxID=413964 RepID=A0AAW9S350_9BACT